VRLWPPYARAATLGSCLEAIARLHETVAVCECCGGVGCDARCGVLKRSPHARRRNHAAASLKRAHQQRDAARRTRRRHRRPVHQRAPLATPLRHRRDGAARRAHAHARIPVRRRACTRAPSGVKKTLLSQMGARRGPHRGCSSCTAGPASRRAGRWQGGSERQPRTRERRVQPRR
jgi:hypothetical protein